MVTVELYMTIQRIFQSYLGLKFFPSLNFSKKPQKTTQCSSLPEKSGDCCLWIPVFITEKAAFFKTFEKLLCYPVTNCKYENRARNTYWLIFKLVWLENLLHIFVLVKLMYLCYSRDKAR